jgi:hypothetical protein
MKFRNQIWHCKGVPTIKIGDKRRTQPLPEETREATGPMLLAQAL